MTALGHVEGSKINPEWKISGTHGGKLDAAARARRAIKKRNYQANQAKRVAENQDRNNRSGRK